MSLYLADRWIKRSEVQSQNNPSRLKLSQSRFVRQCQKRYARILIDGVLRQGDSNAIRGSPTSLMLTCANTLTARGGAAVGNGNLHPVGSVLRFDNSIDRVRVRMLSRRRRFPVIDHGVFLCLPFDNSLPWHLFPLGSSALENR
jgi:hypothetical protein